MKNSLFKHDKNNSMPAAQFAKQVPSSSDFKHFLEDIENFITETASMTGDDLATAKLHLKERVDAIKTSAEEMGESISSKANKGVQITNHYVHEKPWTAIGISAAVGLVIGLLATHRSKPTR